MLLQPPHDMLRLALNLVCDDEVQHVLLVYAHVKRVRVRIIDNSVQGPDLNAREKLGYLYAQVAHCRQLRLCLSIHNRNVLAHLASHYRSLKYALVRVVLVLLHIRNVEPRA